MARLLGEVAGEALERLIFLLGLLVGHTVGAAHALERRHENVALHTRGGEKLLRGRPLLFHEGEEEMLGRHVRIAEGFGLLVGAVQDTRHLARQRGLGRRARLPREAVDLPLRLGAELGDVEPGLLEQGHNDAIVLREQSEEEMGVVDDRIAARAGQLAGLLQRFGRLDGQTLGSNHGGLWGRRRRKQRLCRAKVPFWQKGEKA